MKYVYATLITIAMIAAGVVVVGGLAWFLFIGPLSRM